MPTISAKEAKLEKVFDIDDSGASVTLDLYMRGMLKATMTASIAVRKAHRSKLFFFSLIIPMSATALMLISLFDVFILETSLLETWMQRY
jgi:hypothetical protein